MVIGNCFICAREIRGDESFIFLEPIMCPRTHFCSNEVITKTILGMEREIIEHQQNMNTTMLK